MKSSLAFVVTKIAILMACTVNAISAEVTRHALLDVLPSGIDAETVIDLEAAYEGVTTVALNTAEYYRIQFPAVAAGHEVECQLRGDTSLLGEEANATTIPFAMANFFLDSNKDMSVMGGGAASDSGNMTLRALVPEPLNGETDNIMVVALLSQQVDATVQLSCAVSTATTTTTDSDSGARRGQRSKQRRALAMRLLQSTSDISPMAMQETLSFSLEAGASQVVQLEPMPVTANAADNNNNLVTCHLNCGDASILPFAGYFMQGTASADGMGSVSIGASCAMALTGSPTEDGGKFAVTITSPPLVANDYTMECFTEEEE